MARILCVLLLERDCIACFYPLKSQCAGPGRAPDKCLLRRCVLPHLLPQLESRRPQFLPPLLQQVVQVLRLAIQALRLAIQVLSLILLPHYGYGNAACDSDFIDQHKDRIVHLHHR